MLIVKLAFRNIVGAGLRTWLSVLVLSFSFVAIIFLQGFYEGLNEQVERATVDALYGGGQYWHAAYNPYDPLSLDDAHGPLSPDLRTLVAGDSATPILIRRGAIYPQGRFRSVLLKGIDPGQRILSVPSALLNDTSDAIPAVIGGRMARGTGLAKGDRITIQWRDVHGTFDARDARIVEIFKTTVQEIDNDQIWIPLEQLRRLAGMADEATVVVVRKGTVSLPAVDGWEFKNLDFLLQDLHALVRMKSIQGTILYSLLLFLAMLAIFDTQVLSVWRRRKEIGTLMALGMTRLRVVALFTLEGAMHGVLAGVVAAAYGIPIFASVAEHGFSYPAAADSFGIALGEKLFPVYTPALVVETTLLVCIVTTIVSFLPTRKIVRLKPTDALRGRIA